MKHLKTYNENNEGRNIDIYRDLVDICLELNDDGLSTKVSALDNKFEISITKSTPPNIFKFKDVYEVIERIKDYMGERGYLYKVKIYNHWNYVGDGNESPLEVFYKNDRKFDLIPPDRKLRSIQIGLATHDKFGKL